MVYFAHRKRVSLDTRASRVSVIFCRISFTTRILRERLSLARTWGMKFRYAIPGD